MEKPQSNLIATDASPDNIEEINNLDLNTLFNLSYNFDILKGIISFILKNQKSLQIQLEKEKKINKAQSQAIESLEYYNKSLKDKFVSKESFNKTQNQIDELESKMNQFDEKLFQIENNLSKRKKN